MNLYVASTWKRLGARCVDQVFVTLLMAPVIWHLPSDGEGFLRVPLWTGLSLLSVPVFYEGLFYSFFHATPGKWIFGLQVIPASDSTAAGWGFRIFSRVLLSQLSFFFLWAIYATALWRSDRRHLADWWAQTRVVGHESAGVLPPRWFSGSLLVVMGLASGWPQAQEQLRNLEVQAGHVIVPDPFDIHLEE